MIAVIFEVQPTDEGRAAYLDHAAALTPLLAQRDGFISVERFQSLANPAKLLSLSFWRDVAHALEALLRVADARDGANEPAADVKRWQRPAMRGLRHARSCYGHLAGELGVQWREALLARGWVTATPEGRYAVSEAGREALAALTPEGFTETGRALYDCVDWSERRDHFAGPLAVAWLEAMVAKGWLRRAKDSRELQRSGGASLLDEITRRRGR